MPVVDVTRIACATAVWRQDCAAVDAMVARDAYAAGKLEAAAHFQENAARESALARAALWALLAKNGPAPRR